MATKNPLESTTIIAAIVGLLSYYFMNFTSVEVSQDELMRLAQHVFVIGSFVYAIYGRWKAQGPIKLFKSDTIKVDVSALDEAKRNALKGILSGERK